MSLWNTRELLLSEMLIKRKDSIDFKLAHYLEAGTIDQHDNIRQEIAQLAYAFKSSS